MSLSSIHSHSSNSHWTSTPFDNWLTQIELGEDMTNDIFASSENESTASTTPNVKVVSPIARALSPCLDEMAPLPLEDTLSPPPRIAFSPTPISETSQHEASYICPDTQAEFSWYFAIGSMINPTSLSLRKLEPLESYPGILRGWRLVFRGDCGMASILPIESQLPSLNNHSIPRDDFHGVLHRLMKDQMAKLDVIENSYERLEVYVECYDGRLQKATVYKMAESKLDPSKPDALPSERYLDIISRGCVHFGISRDYIQWLRSHRCIRRKRPSDYKKIPVHELHQSGLKHLQMTAQELTKYDGRMIGDGEELVGIEENEVCSYSCTPGILSIASSPTIHYQPPSSSPPTMVLSPTQLANKHNCSSPSPSTSPSSPTVPPSNSSTDRTQSQSQSQSDVLPSPSPEPMLRRFYPLRIAVNKKILEWIGDLNEPLLANTYEFIRENFGGTDLTHSYTCVFFEPLYPIVAKYDDMSAEHRAMVEDIFAEKVLNPNLKMREWKLVGFLSTEEQKESQQAGQVKLLQRRLGLRRNESTGSLVDPNDTAFDFESNMSNMFLSLSMEDHSGASSTCFAYCCAGAQPFHAQLVREQQFNSLATPNTRVRSRRRLKQQKGERKRRHSIGNVGLHAQVAASAANESMTLPIAAAASQSASYDSTADVSNSATNTSTSSSSSSSSSKRTGGKLPYSQSQMHPSHPLPSRQRAQSICTGILASAHTPTAASLCVSPKRSINLSLDDMQVTSPTNHVLPTPSNSCRALPSGS